MATNPIQWFPGHMAKTRRMMKECLPEVDLVLELLDSRIPHSSRNPEIEKLLENKPKVTVLTKAALANPDLTARWVQKYSQTAPTVAIDSVDSKGIAQLSDAVNSVMAEKLQRYRDKGMSTRHLRAMIVGIPNVGKSSLINKLAGGKKAKVEDRPGVTVNKQWVPTSIGLDLLDMPGVLWPKFEDETVGQNLAITGAIKDMILDIEEIACLLVSRLRKIAPEALIERYKITEADLDDELLDYDVLEAIGRKRGFLAARGEINTERTAIMLLEEFRSGKIGRISLEIPY